MVNDGNIKTGAWDPEEDELLYYWQGKVGNKWSEVAKHIPGRTGQQCAQRWRHKVNPNIRRDKWTPEEDAKLIELVKTFGVGRWAEIARNCDGRTDQQCMGRWRRHLDPNIRRDSWSPEEDAKLRQLHAQYGTSWSRISKNLKGRTSQQCRARWHQLNNGRSKASSSGAAAAAAITPASTSNKAGAARKGQSSKRKPSRRRHDSSCSEDEDEEEPDDIYDDDDEEDEDAEQQEQGGSSGSHRGTLAQQYSHSDQQEFAAAAAAGYGLNAADMQQWMPEFAALAGQLAACAAGAQIAPQQEQQQQQEHPQHDSSSAEEQADAENDADADADEVHTRTPGRSGRATAAGARQAAPISRYRSLPPKLNSQGVPARELKHAGSMPNSRRGSTKGCASPRSSLWAGAQQQQLEHAAAAGGPHWSPSRLLLSPTQPFQHDRLWRQGHVADDNDKELNEEEAAGAETLLEMASLLRHESCELQPPSLRRGDFIPACTPPKRAAERPDDDDLPAALSPSPYKRARSSRTALFAGSHAGEEPPSRSEVQHRAARSPQAPAAGLVKRLEDGLLNGEEAEEPAAAAAASGAGKHAVASSSHSRRVAYHRSSSSKGCSFAYAAAEQGEVGEEEEEEQVQQDGEAGDEEDEAAAAGGLSNMQRGLAAEVGPLMDFGLQGGSNTFKQGQLDPPDRPSNASSLTGLRGADVAAAAAAAVATAAAAAATFMSPPPASRGSRWGRPGSAMATPSRPTPQQQNLMNLLGSPMFERMVGCATPPSAGRTQPSAATLAALQSPQPSRVHEPFWTPFTGLFQDALFSRGISATPDLPSGGKPNLPRGLFSPASQRSGSGGKSMPRRTLLHGSDASPAAGTALDTDEDKASQPSAGGSAECGTSAGAAENEPGPSPAAAYGLQQPPANPVHHRVVRRLDQHEAWGISRVSPSKTDRTGVSKEERLMMSSGAGFSLFSPVKKQRVPLFNEGATIKVGESPAKPQDSEHLLPIAPLRHDLPLDRKGSTPQQQQQQHLEQQLLTSPREHAAAAGAASPMLHGRSPLGPKAGRRGHGSAWQHPAPAQLLTPAGSRHQIRQAAGLAHQPAQHRLAAADDEHSLQQQQQQQQQRQQTGSERKKQAEQEDVQEQVQEQQAEQQQGQQDPQLQPLEPAVPALQRVASITQTSGQMDEPDTPVNTQDSADKTSCAGTPNTPADEPRANRQQEGGSMGEYITPPQHRLRPSRPLAPLHKDCLIAAANRSLADAQQQQQRRQQEPPQAASSVAANARQDQQSSSPASGSADSSKLVSCHKVIDSPLEPCAQLQSPSQWHQGMVAMLRSLQRTPLQAKGPGDTAAAPASSAEDGAITASKPCEHVGTRGCSRALRRLQDELERGTAVAAAKQQQQPQQQSTLQGDASVPFTAGLSLLAPASTAGVPVNSCSTPLVLPLFTSPMVMPGSSHAQHNSNADTIVARSTTPLAHARPGSSSVASVSLTPAVVTLHKPAVPGGALSLTPAAPAGGAPGHGPAVAWPVQQRSDGGLVVTAPMAGEATAAGTLVQLTPPAATTSTTKPVVSAAAAAATHAGSEQNAAGAASQWLQVSPLSVVSIQPLTLLATACSAAVAAGQAAALQSVLALPVKACGNAAGTATGSAGAAAAAVPELRSTGMPGAGSAGAVVRDSSHTVRSRLHALIDGV